MSPVAAISAGRSIVTIGVIVSVVCQESVMRPAGLMMDLRAVTVVGVKPRLADVVVVRLWYG